MLILVSPLSFVSYSLWAQIAVYHKQFKVIDITMRFQVIILLVVLKVMSKKLWH